MGGKAQDTVGDRLHALDLVRGFALILGIWFHASMSMLPGAQAWQVRDIDQSAAIAAITFTLHSFRMATFFLMAGFFGRMILARRGAAGFAKDRAKRVLLPFAIFLALLLGIYAAVLNLGIALGMVKLAPGFSLWSFASPTKIPLLHLWFLYVLSLLYAAALAAHLLLGKLDPAGRLHLLVDRIFAALLRSGPLLPLLFALPTAAWLLGQPHWLEYWGVVTPQDGLVPNVASMAIYGMALSAGWLLYRQEHGLEALRRWWLPNLVLALGCSIAALAMIGTGIVPEPLLHGTELTIFALLYGAMMWCWSFGLIGFALRFLDRRMKWARYLADSSYWLYLVHLPLVVALQVLVMEWKLPAELKLALILGVTLALLLGSYELFVRHSAVGALLNGKRVPRSKT